MFKQKSIILTVILSIFIGLNACNKNENVEAIKQLSEVTLDQIETITSIVKANPEAGTILKNGFAQSGLSVDSKNLRGTSEEVPAELQAAIDAFNSNPTAVLTSIAQESQGTEKIALLEGLFTQKDAQTLENRAEVFVPVDIPPAATTGIIPTNNFSNRNGRGVACSGDCKLHVMAGAAIAMGVSATVYAAASWFSWQIKAVMIVGVGFSAGVLFGAAIGAGSIFLGWNTVKCCVFNQCPC